MFLFLSVDLGFAGLSCTTFSSFLFLVHLTLKIIKLGLHSTLSLLLQVEALQIFCFFQGRCHLNFVLLQLGLMGSTGAFQSRWMDDFAFCSCSGSPVAAQPVSELP